MTRTLSVRVDGQTQHELAELTRDGTFRNSAIVEAVHEAYRRATYERMRREAEELDKDPEDRAELRAAREALTGHEDAW